MTVKETLLKQIKENERNINWFGMTIENADMKHGTNAKLAMTSLYAPKMKTLREENELIKQQIKGL